jgi:hypothetical protein
VRRRSSALSPGYFVLSRYFALINRPMHAANTLPSRYVAFTSLMMTPHVFVPAEKVRASRGITHHVDIMTHGWHHPTATDRGIDRICFVGSSCSFSRMQGKDFLGTVARLFGRRSCYLPQCGCFKLRRRPCFVPHRQ